MADYRNMWEKLGMNLEKHDQLCEVLPSAFGSVFIEQQNRPEGMNYFNLVISEIHGFRPAELIAHQEKNNKAIFDAIRQVVENCIVEPKFDKKSKGSGTDTPKFWNRRFSPVIKEGLKS